MSQIINCVMVGFMVIGAVDRIFLKNRLGMGEELERGVGATGSLLLSMTGLMCGAPLLGRAFTSVFGPLFARLGTDPAMAGGMFLAIDMGGFSIARGMTADNDIVFLSGALMGGTLGMIIVWTIPVALGMCEKKTRPVLCRGIAAGIIASPVCGIAGGLIYGIPAGKLAVNLLPALILVAFLSAALIKFTDATIKVLLVLSDVIQAVSLAFLLSAIFEDKLGVVIIPGLDPLPDQLAVVGSIGVMLMGAYPLVAFVKRALASLFLKAASFLRVDDNAITGMLACLANTIPLFERTDGMTPRGAAVSISFGAAAGAVFGAHLAFLAAVMPDAVAAFIAGKLLCGAAAVLIASLFSYDDEAEKA